MFEKIGRMAETAATKVSASRRGFLGRLGQGALAAAGALGGLLALSNKAQAGKTLYSCSYQLKRGEFKCRYTYCPSSMQSCGGCPPLNCCQLVSNTIIGTC
jgi:hypothetical protein